jgi:tetratricopeptide (TPR) repeat protein
MTTVLVIAAIIALPAFGFALWPLVRRHGSRAFLPLPPDEREQLEEQKRRAVRALRELEFEHGAGHISDDDYADLRTRYETEAAQVLGELDRLGVRPSPRETDRRPPAAARRSAWQHPVALGLTAAMILVFGIVLGVGIVQYSAPEQTATAGMPPGGMGGMTVETPPSAGGGGPIPPGVLQGMLGAARESLFAGNYTSAIQAYQAILKRDPNNPDAITHLGLIVAIGGHADAALESFDKALAIQPDYAPALLYRGQVLYENKNDRAGAINAWERYLKVAPPGEDRDRVVKLLADAKKGPALK